jgi:hypothetical protein
MSAALQLSETVTETYDRTHRLIDLGVYIPQFDRTELAELIPDKGIVLVLSDNDQIGLLGFLWLSVQWGASITETYALLKKLQVLGVDLPKLNLGCLGSIVLYREDLEAAVGAMLAVKDGLAAEEFSYELRQMFFNSDDLDGLSPESPYWLDAVDKFIRSKVEGSSLEMTVSIAQLRIIAEALQEPVESIADRLRKFQPFGLNVMEVDTH